MLSLNVFVFKNKNPNNNCNVMINSFCFFPFIWKMYEKQKLISAQSYVHTNFNLSGFYFSKWLSEQISLILKCRIFFPAIKAQNLTRIREDFSEFQDHARKVNDQTGSGEDFSEFCAGIKDPARIKDLLLSDAVRGIVQVPDSSTLLCW